MKPTTLSLTGALAAALMAGMAEAQRSHPYQAERERQHQHHNRAWSAFLEGRRYPLGVIA